MGQVLYERRSYSESHHLQKYTSSLTVRRTSAISLAVHLGVVARSVSTGEAEIPRTRVTRKMSTGKNLEDPMMVDWCCRVDDGPYLWRSWHYIYHSDQWSARSFLISKVQLEAFNWKYSARNIDPGIFLRMFSWDVCIFHGRILEVHSLVWVRTPDNGR